MRESEEPKNALKNSDISTAQTGVQAYGLVLGVGSDWSIVAVSGTCHSWLGRSADALLGLSFGDVFPDAAVHRLRSQAQVLTEMDPVARLQGCDLGAPGGVADVTMTKSGRDLFFEFEVAEASPGLATEVEQVQRLIRRVSQKSKLSDVVMEAARTVRAIAGFDRVSLHRLGPTGLTTALASTGQPPLSADPSAGLLEAHTNAPLSQLHFLADISAELTPLFLRREAGRTGLDPHPRHLSSLGAGAELHEALRQDGAMAATTLPIRVRDELWGVFLCHNASPLQMTVGKRSALDLYASMFGSELERVWDRAGQLARGRALLLRDKLIDMPAPDDGGDWLFDRFSSELAAILPHEGAVLLSKHKNTVRGHVPDGALLEALSAYLRRRDLRDVLLVDRLTDVGMASDAFDVAGTAVAVVPLSLRAPHMLLLFRRVGSDPNRVKSWSPWETAAATALRAALVDAFLKWSQDSQGSTGHRLYQQQLLIAELSHRVRNVLSLILGMLNLTGERSDGVLIDAQAFESRIKALAKAHDELAFQNWGWIQLNTYLKQECDRVLDAYADRMDVHGEDIDVSPSAFVTISIVLHELMRNAVEHGAFKGDQGRVEARVSRDAEGYAEIAWTETGIDGAAPGPRRLGMTLIREAIPYELRGTASVDLRDDALVAHFRLPPSHVRVSKPQTGQPNTAPSAAVDLPNMFRIDGAALILEDNLVVSLDASTLLREAGATDVYTCNSVESALNALDQGEITFALLDVNLGPETSRVVAEQVWNDGIPAALATGYGANPEILKDFPPLPVVSKPYALADLRKTLQHYFVKSS